LKEKEGHVKGKLALVVRMDVDPGSWTFAIQCHRNRNRNRIPIQHKSQKRKVESFSTNFIARFSLAASNAVTNAIDTRTMSNALSQNMTHSTGPQVYAVGFNDESHKAEILNVCRAHNQRIRELQRMADHEITHEMRMEVGEKFEDFRIAEFKPSQIYTSGPIANYKSVVLFSNANGRWQSFAFLRAHEATKHVIAYEGLGKSRLKSKAPQPFSLKDGTSAAPAKQQRKKPAASSSAAAAAAAAAKSKAPVKKRKAEPDYAADDDDFYDGADDGDAAAADDTAAAVPVAPVKFKIKFKAPKLDDAQPADVALASTASAVAPVAVATATAAVATAAVSNAPVSAAASGTETAASAPIAAATATATDNNNNDDDDDDDDDAAGGWKI
jgi:hypothetical protein